MAQEPLDDVCATQLKRKRANDAGEGKRPGTETAALTESSILFASRFHLQRAFGLPADQVAAITARMMLVPQLQKMPAVLIPLIESYFGAPTMFSHTAWRAQGLSRATRDYRVERWSSPTSFTARAMGEPESAHPVAFVWNDHHSDWCMEGDAVPLRHQDNWGLEYEISLFNHFRELQRPVLLRLACGHVASARTPTSIINRMTAPEECWTVDGTHILMMMWGGGGASNHTSLLVLCDPADAELVCAECKKPVCWQAWSSDILAGLIRGQATAIAPISPLLAAALGRV